MNTIYDINFETYSERFNVVREVNLYAVLSSLFNTGIVWIRQLGNNRFAARIATCGSEYEVLEAADSLAFTLLQDCVAIARIGYDENNVSHIEKGELVGPYAGEWGPFKEEYFVKFED